MIAQLFSVFGKLRAASAMLLISSFLATNARATSISAWDFTGGSAPANQLATVSDSHLASVPNLTRGTGVAASSAANSFRTTGFRTNSTPTSIYGTTNYFQATFTAATGYTLSLSSINAVYSGTQTFVGTAGVTNQYAYSLNGTTFTAIGSPAILTGTVPLTSPTVDLTGISALQNVAAGTTVYIRYYAAGQTGTGGWGYISVGGAGNYGLNVGGVVLPVPPSAPSVSAASATNSSGFTANWSTAATATGYQLDVATDSGFTSLVINNFDVGNVTSTNVTGLSASTVYYYRVRAYNAGGASGNSSTITVTTIANGTPKIVVTLPGETFTSGTGNSGTASSRTAGSAFNITLTATTDGTNANTGYFGTKTIIFSGPTGSPTYPSTVSFTSGTGTANITLTKAETTTITAVDSGTPIAGAPSSSLTVNPGAINSYTVAAASPQTTNTVFTVAVAAKDANNNIVTTDNSTVVTMTANSGNLQFDSNGDGTYGDNTITLSSGTNIISAIDVATAPELVIITATDTTPKAGASSSIVINLIPQYRSKQSGYWADYTTWQVNYGSGFADATSSSQAPTNTNVNIDTIEIRTGHIVTNALAITVDQVTVDAGGEIVAAAALTVANGPGTDMDVFGILNNSANIVQNPNATIVFESVGRYQHNVAITGTIPTATWMSGSTCEIDNLSSSSTSAPFGLGQSFYNFTWNCPSQGAAVSMGGALQTVNGDLTVISTGTKDFRFGAGTSPTINIGGNWIVLGGTNTCVTGAGSPIINLAGNLIVSGGGLNESSSGSGTNTINFGGNVSVTGGTLFLGAGHATNNFVRAGTQYFTNTATISGAIAWNVNDGSTLSIGTGSTVGGTGGFTVSGLGTVSGSGTISGPATVNGTLAPGTASTYGTLAFTAAPTLNGTNSLKIDRNGGTPLADKIVFSGGTLTYGGALTVANLGAALQPGDSFTNFSASGYGGAFTSTNLPTLTGSYAWDTSPLNVRGSITVLSGLTPSPIPLSLNVAGATLTFTWTDSSFNLQSATNVSGPYVTIPSATSPFATNSDPTIPALFFRLYHP